MALPACNQGATGSYRGIAVNSLGNAGVYRHEPWLHRAAANFVLAEIFVLAENFLLAANFLLAEIFVLAEFFCWQQIFY